MKEEKVPFENLIFAGVNFKVINRHEAHTIIGDLTDFENEKIYDVFEDTWRFPDDEDNAVFLLAENDVEMDLFEMDYGTEEHQDIFILGFIFKGNLTVKKCISSFDTDNSPALIVLGKTTAPNIILFGNVHYLGGGLECETVIGEYNHGELLVKGDTISKLIYSDDMRMRFENFTSVQTIFNLNRPDVSICSRLSDGEGSIVILENYFPSTNKLSDIVADSYIEHSDYDDETLADDYYEKVFKKGLSLIDESKSERYLYKNFRERFKNMLEELTGKEYAAIDGSLYYEDDYAKYSFVPFDYEDKKYLQISTTILNGFNIRMRGFLCIDTDEISLLLEYLYDDESTKCQWMDNENALGIEYFAVKNAIVEAFEILNDEKSFEDNDESDDDESEYAEYENNLTLEEYAVQFGNYKLPEDLIKLYEFEQEYGIETYTECFGLTITDDKTGIKTWSEEEEFYNSFIEFAGANGSGSSYAYWLIDKDLDNCPIVVFGDEGGIHVVAENTRKLIQLLTLDTEISVDFDYAYFYQDEEYYEESENKEAFREWVKKEFNLEPVETNEDAEVIVDEAKAKYKKRLNEFLVKFDIEIGEEDENE